MIEVVGTDEFSEWYQKTLSEQDAEAVTRTVETLASVGLALGHPLSSQIKGSKYAIRELRIQSQGNPIRVFYAFDKKRQAVLIIGGDKTGDDRFYETFIPIAERIWEEYMAEQ